MNFQYTNPRDGDQLWVSITSPTLACISVIEKEHGDFDNAIVIRLADIGPRAAHHLREFCREAEAFRNTTPNP